MCRPCSTTSSPVLTIAVISAGGPHLHEPGQEAAGADAAGEHGDHRGVRSIASR